MEEEVFTRKELYDLVWCTPVLTLSRKYKVSESSLRALCRKHNIPLPPAGHWRKVERNKPFMVKPLPRISKQEERITLKLRATGEEDARILMKTDPENLQEVLPLKVPSRLTNPDPLIVAAKVSLTSGRGRHYQLGGLIWTAEGQLDIRVAPRNVSRALRFMDALIKLVRVRGHDFDINHGVTCAIVKQQKIEIQLKELMTSVNVEHKSSYPGGSWTSRKYKATGKLALCVGRLCVKEYNGAKRSLEDQLWPILIKLEAEADKLNQEQVMREKRRKEEQERLRIERELREQKEKELTAFKDLMHQAQRWQQAKIMRQYLEAVECRARADESLTDELKKWIHWARQKVDELDPLLNKSNTSILGDKYRGSPVENSRSFDNKFYDIP